MTRIIAIVALALSALLMVHCGSTIAGNDGGGTITETIGILGTLVDTTGMGLPGATVHAVAGQQEFITQTNEHGDYVLDSVAVGPYTISAVYGDSELVALVGLVEAYNLTYWSSDAGDTILAMPEGKKGDKVAVSTIRLDTLYAPGSISGTAVLSTGPVVNLMVNIPGTSYAAWTDTDGSFLMTNVAPGSYKLNYSYNGYVSVQSLQVKVYPGQSSSATPVTLERDPSGLPPSPQNLSSVYDTAAGTTTLSWSPVVVADLAGYRVYADTGKGAFALVSGLLDDTTFAHGLYTQTSDITEMVIRYQVVSVDSDNNISNFSAVHTVNAVSPSRIETHFSWSVSQDSVTVGDTVTVIVDYENAGRSVVRLSWSKVPASQLLRQTDCNNRAGNDTLQIVPPDSGMITLRVEAEDELGHISTDSMAIRVNASLVPRDTWLPAGNLPQGRKEIELHTVNGILYALGGSNKVVTGIAAAAAIYQFNPLDSSWIECASLDSGRYQFASTVYNESIYIFGGIGNLGAMYRSVIRFTPATGELVTVAQLPAARFGASACVIDSAIYLFGGMQIDRRANYTILNRIDRFNPSTGQCDSVGALLDRRQNHRTVVTNGIAYTLGGIATYSYDQTSLSSVESFDPSTGQQSRLLPMTTGRTFFGAVIMDGVIYAVGGFGPVGTTALTTTEKCVPGSAWNICSPLPSPLHSFGAAVHNGTLVIAGGNDGSISSSGENSGVLRYYP